MTRRLATALLFLPALLLPRSSFAAAADENFYRGKTIRIIVGFAAEAAFDAYARVLARHMGKHIPDNPSIIVDNMTGAGSRVATNFPFKAAPDGLAIGKLYRVAPAAANYGR